MKCKPFTIFSHTSRSIVCIFYRALVHQNKHAFVKLQVCTYVTVCNINIYRQRSYFFLSAFAWKRTKLQEYYCLIRKMSIVVYLLYNSFAWDFWGLTFFISSRTRDPRLFSVVLGSPLSKFTHALSWSGY